MPGGRAPKRIALKLCLLTVVGGCAGEGTSPFDKTYVALVYGQVTRTGGPVSGVTVRGDIYFTTCPSSPLQQTSSQSTQTESDGRYRLLLSSNDQDEGQCLVLTVEGATPILRTLDQTPFLPQYPGPPTDSVEIDVTLP